MSRILFDFFDGDQTLVVVGIPSAEAFGTPEVSDGDELLVTGIPSAETFGTPDVFEDGEELLVTGIPSEEAFGSPAVTPATRRYQQLSSPWGGGGGVAPLDLFLDPQHPFGVEIVPTPPLLSRREEAQEKLRPWVEVEAVPEDLWALFDDHTYPIKLAYGAVWLWARVRGGGLSKEQQRDYQHEERERQFWSMVAAVEEAARARAALDLALVIAAADVSRAAADVSKAAADVSRAAAAVEAALKRKKKRKKRKVKKVETATQPALDLRYFQFDAPAPVSAPVRTRIGLLPLLLGGVAVYALWRIFFPTPRKTPHFRVDVRKAARGRPKADAWRKKRLKEYA